VNRIYHSESDKLATTCGFQEMPNWSINPVDLEHLRKDSQTLGTVWKTMNASPENGLNHA